MINVMGEYRKLLADKNHVDQRAKRIVHVVQVQIGWMPRAERRKHERATKKALIDKKLEEEYRLKFLMLD